MNGLKMSFSLLALLLVLPVACSKSGADGDGDESPRPYNKAAPETPAPVQPEGKGFVSARISAMACSRSGS